MNKNSFTENKINNNNNNSLHESTPMDYDPNWELNVSLEEGKPANSHTYGILNSYSLNTIIYVVIVFVIVVHVC
jgi:hypothetical protein